MTSSKWQALMTRWSSELMAGALAESVVPPPRSADWLGEDPASKQELKELEARLGLILPPSYRSFLLVSNGWRRTTFAVDRIRPAAEVDWFRVENENWVDLYSGSGSDLGDEAYYSYPGGKASDHRPDHMKSLVQISDVDDGVYLLNPMAVTPDGEWEAWFFANWVPGAIRYPSFAHLMLGEYLSFASQHQLATSPKKLPKLVLPTPEIPRGPAERIPTPIDKAATLDQLIDQMRTLGGKALERALRVFVGKLQGRFLAQRRPELVPVLADLFHSSRHAGVRSVCIQAITEWTVEPPPALLESLSDPDPWVVSSGINALHYFPNPEAIGPPCVFIETRAESPANAMVNENAMSALGAIGDDRAVPTLLGVLVNTSNPFPQSFGTAAIALSRCGLEGYEALVSALDHGDPRVRHAGVVGINCSGNPGAEALLARMESDPDLAVRERARMRIGKLSF